MVCARILFKQDFDCNLVFKQLSEQEDLIVWMRTAALPTFRKLFGKIEVDLAANEVITVVLQNNYNTYSFGGKKKLVLSTTSWLGGKNDFLGIAYLTVGSLCFFLAMAFSIVYLVKPRSVSWSHLVKTQLVTIVIYDFPHMWLSHFCLAYITYKTFAGPFLR